MMRLPVMIYAVWPWEPEHRVHEAPVQLAVHTRAWFLAIRPFSNFAQGGDRRGEITWREWKDRGGEGPEPTNPWLREKSAKWVLQDEDPEIWARLDYRAADLLLRRGRYARCTHRNHRTGWRSCIWSIDYDGQCALHHGCDHEYTDTGAADEPDVCRPLTLTDGQTARVRGEKPMNEQDVAAFAEIVEAARRRYTAEHGQPRPEDRNEEEEDKP